MNTTYTKIPLEQLNLVRSTLNAHLKSRTEATGTRYRTRTFYLGPRQVYGSRRQGSTNKSDATAAKVGIYQENGQGYRSGCFDLAYYI